MKLTDESIMPFGIHKGKKLIKVPADYLLYIYEWYKLKPDLKEYIKTNFDAITARVEEDKKCTNH